MRQRFAPGKSRLRTALILAAFLLVAALGAVLIFLWHNRTNGMILSGGERRSYLLYVPESYQPGSPAALVISMHGFAEWPAHQMQISRWNDLADQEGFLMVYPAGTDLPMRWRAGGGENNTVGPARDVQFISDLIDHLQQEYSIDPARIYANGLSNGGGMSFLLACKLSDRIAAAGGVAGAYLLPWSECSSERTVPFIAFHGTIDPVVPYQGGPSRSFDVAFPVIEDWVSAYADRSGCAPEPARQKGPGAVSELRYSGCEPGAGVVFYSIEGGGHTWPGGDPLPEFITGPNTRDIDATRLMWEFFEQYRLPE